MLSILFPSSEDRIFLAGFSAAALPCWEQDQATKSLHWTPAEVSTDSYVQCLDEGNHPGTSPGLYEREKKHTKEE